MDYSYNYDYSATPDAGAGAAMGIFAAAMLIPLIIGLVVYIYFALCLMTIAKKTNTPNSWFAWIPILNIILMLQISKRPMWWIILMLIPLINIIVSIIVWMDIAVARNKPNWIGILMIVPIANIIVPGYLAFSD